MGYPPQGCGVQNPPNLDVPLSSRASEAMTQLDISLSDLRDATRTIISEELGKEAGETLTVCSNQDISGGVIQALKNYNRWSLYLKVAGAIDITIEISPDGSTWYEPAESPVSFAAAGDDVLEMGYDAAYVRLTGSNTQPVTAQIRGVF